MLQEIIDDRGSILRGHKRHPSGAIVVDDQQQYFRASAEKERLNRISNEMIDLKSQVANLESLVKSLLDSRNNNG